MVCTKAERKECICRVRRENIPSPTIRVERKGVNEPARIPVNRCELEINKRLGRQYITVDNGLFHNTFEEVREDRIESKDLKNNTSCVF